MKYAFARLKTAALATALVLTTAVAAQAEMVLHRGIGAEPGTLDPHRASGIWEEMVIGDLFLGLTDYAADGSIIPGAAENWTVSDDGLTYTFKLRPGQKWSDGQPVTAADFVAAFQRLLDPKTAGEYAYMLHLIKNGQGINNGEITDFSQLGAKAVDDVTLQVTLTSPSPYFISQLAHYTAFPIPKHVVDKVGDDWVKPGNMVGNGAYQLVEWIPNTHVKTVKNPHFYDAANVKIDTVFYYPTEDHDSALKRFRAGELDTQHDFSSEAIDLLRRELPNETHIAPEQSIYYYVFNTKKKPFDDVRVRRALSMAIHRQAITDQVLKTGEVPAYSFVPRGTHNYPEPAYADFKDMPYDQAVAKAKELLAEAGYGPDNPLKFQLRYNTSTNHERIAVAIQAMWKAIGVQAELFNSETAVHYDDLEAGNFDVARAGWVADYDDAHSFLSLLTTEIGPQNYGRYSSPEYDKLMDQAETVVDLEARGKLMQQAEAIAMADQPVAPIYYYVSKELVQSWVKGWVDNIRNVHRTRWMSVERSS
jgi:oligopeptide transport system substrate-binding protein